MYSQDENQQPIVRKLRPQKITLADIMEEYSPEYRNKKIKKRKTEVLEPERMVLKPIRFNLNSTSWEGSSSKDKKKKNNIAMDDSRNKSKKVVLKSSPFVFNAADWEDTPPLNKPKGKGSKIASARKEFLKKNLVGGKVNSTQTYSKYVSAPVHAKGQQKIKTTETVRKELFTSSKTKMSRSPLHQIPMTVVGSTKTSKLNNTQPLIDMGAIETELIKSSHIFPQQMNHDTPLKQIRNLGLPVSQKSEISECRRALKKCKSISPLITISKPDITITDYSLNAFESPTVFSCDTDILNKNYRSNLLNSISDDEREFIKNERRCGSAKFSSNDNLEEIITVLQYHQIRYNNLKETCTNLQQKFKTVCNGLQKEIELFQEQIQTSEESYVQDVDKIVTVLKNRKTKFKMDTEWNISTEAVAGPSVSKSMSTIKKNVTFDLKSETMQDDCISLNDNGLEKSVILYNSLRKGYKNLLSTPTLNRTGLQTPKSKKNSRRDSVSRKVQKQCLLLLDTPANKNKKVL